jgi:hypothetical protein
MTKIGDLVRIKRYGFLESCYDIGIVISDLKKLHGELDYETEKQLAMTGIPWVNVYLLKDEKVVEAYPYGNLEIISSS